MACSFLPVPIGKGYTQALSQLKSFGPIWKMSRYVAVRIVLAKANFKGRELKIEVVYCMWRALSYLFSSFWECDATLSFLRSTSNISNVPDKWVSMATFFREARPTFLDSPQAVRISGKAAVLFRGRTLRGRLYRNFHKASDISNSI